MNNSNHKNSINSYNNIFNCTEATIKVLYFTAYVNCFSNIYCVISGSIKIVLLYRHLRNCFFVI